MTSEPDPTAGDNANARGSAARRLIRRCGHAALATLLDRRPYVSLVACACDIDGHPLLLLSDLAQHTKNLLSEPSVSLLFEDALGHPQPLSRPRLTLLGYAERCDEPHLLARFSARHPDSVGYAQFGDFHLYRVRMERGHMVAGFGRIFWVGDDALRSGDAGALAVAEAEIVAHMNSDHADALDLYAQNLLDLPGTGWRMTGIDPDGIDLVLIDDAGPRHARVEFVERVLTPAAAPTRWSHWHTRRVRGV